MSVSIRVSVSKGRVPVYLRSRIAGSLSFPILACSLVQDPRGPASFPHAVTYYPNNALWADRTTCWETGPSGWDVIRTG